MIFSKIIIHLIVDDIIGLELLSSVFIEEFLKSDEGKSVLALFGSKRQSRKHKYKLYLKTHLIF